MWWNAVLGEAFVPLAHGVLDGQATFEFLTKFNVLGTVLGHRGTGALDCHGEAVSMCRAL